MEEILKGLNITVNKCEIHVIMGPNGAGKSTLANVILNNPEYKKTSGEIDFEGEKNALFGDIAKSALAYSKGKNIDFIKLGSEFSKNAIKNAEPFYKAK